MGATRFSYGYYPWRVDAYLRAQWSFSCDGDSRDPYEALPSGARVSCDYRYIQLLEEMIAAADDGAAKRAAQATLSELRDAVNATYLAPENNWDRSTMDYWRWQVAKAAMRLAD